MQKRNGRKRSSGAACTTHPKPAEYLRLPVEYGSARAVREVLERQCTCWEQDPDRAGDFALAVSEAFTNAVRHGSGGQEDAVEVWLSSTAEGCEVLLEYPGNPFPVPEPSLPEALASNGRGRFLMDELSDTVEYEFTEGRTRVRLKKRWAPR